MQLPPSLNFNNETCELDLFPGKCHIDLTTNLVTLTDLVTADMKAGEALKFLIVKANNPNGARHCGPWSIASQVNVDGIWYVVDKTIAKESFYARPGYLNAEVHYKNVTTGSTDTNFTFSFETEHDIPKQGQVVVNMPASMNVTEQVFSVGFLILEYTANNITLSVPEGHPKLTKLRIELHNLRNPRSYQPSAPFVI